jgi:hypothetical protein
MVSTRSGRVVGPDQTHPAEESKRARSPRKGRSSGSVRQHPSSRTAPAELDKGGHATQQQPVQHFNNEALPTDEALAKEAFKVRRMLPSGWLLWKKKEACGWPP